MQSDDKKMFCRRKNYIVLSKSLKTRDLVLDVCDYVERKAARNQRGFLFRVGCNEFYSTIIFK
eukprot:UN10715